MNECFNDFDTVVRRHVWGGMRQTQCLTVDQKQQLIEKLGAEQDEVVLNFVNDVRSSIQK